MKLILKQAFLSALLNKPSSKLTYLCLTSNSLH